MLTMVKIEINENLSNLYKINFINNCLIINKSSELNLIK